MATITYTQNHHEFRTQFRAFLEREIVPHRDQWDRDRLIPKTVWQKMGQQGYLCMNIPPQYGGPGKDFLHSMIVIEETARINYMALFAYLHTDIVVPYIHTYGTEAQKQKILPGCVSGDIITAVAMTEPNAGSDLSAMTTLAQEAGDEFILDGTKTFISNGINCDLVVVAARDPGVDNPHKAISLFLVEADRPGFKKGRPLDKMGLHSQDTAELFFTNCRIPRQNLLGQKGQGFPMLMEKLQQERLVCAIGGISAAKYIFNTTLDYWKQTKEKPLGTSQAAEFAFAEMATQIQLGSTFVEDLVVRHMEKEPLMIQTSMAKYWTTDLAKRMGDQCLDLVGESALMDSCPIVQAYKDVRVMSIFAGTNEIMKGIIARSLGI